MRESIGKRCDPRERPPYPVKVPLRDAVPLGDTLEDLLVDTGKDARHTGEEGRTQRHEVAWARDWGKAKRSILQSQVTLQHTGQLPGVARVEADLASAVPERSLLGNENGK